MKPIGKLKDLWLLLILIVLLTIVFTNVMLWWQRRYPDNEWHSRHDCVRHHLQNIRSSLWAYIEIHGNNIPYNLHELVSLKYLGRSTLVCPSQFSYVRDGGYIEEDSPLFVTSYLVIEPGGDFTELQDGSIIVKELVGNHFESTVGGEHLSAGYHVIKKDKGLLAIEFIELNAVVSK